MTLIKQNLLELIADEKNLENSYKKACKGVNKYSKEAMEFSKNLTYNLNQLRESLLNNTYEFSGYIKFKVYEPKERIIHAPHFVDKIVQHAINDVIKHKIYKYFINDTYACIEHRGTHRAVDKVQEFMRSAYNEWGENAYIIKLDVKKFFYSIDRKILKNILKKIIDHKETLLLLFKIIDSADDISEKGLPLGNTLSQLFANLVLNKLDQFCKRILRIKYYVRYMDDSISIVKNKRIALNFLVRMRSFLKTKLNLDINEDKSKIFPINNGVNAYGFKIYRTHRLLRNQSKKKIKRKLKKIPRLVMEGKLHIQIAETMINGWFGHAMYGNSFNFICKLISKYKYIEFDKTYRLRINESKLKEYYMNNI